MPFSPTVEIAILLFIKSSIQTNILATFIGLCVMRWVNWIHRKQKLITNLSMKQASSCCYKCSWSCIIHPKCRYTHTSLWKQACIVSTDRKWSLKSIFVEAVFKAERSNFLPDTCLSFWTINQSSLLVGWLDMGIRKSLLHRKLVSLMEVGLFPEVHIFFMVLLEVSLDTAFSHSLGFPLLCWNPSHLSYSTKKMDASAADLNSKYTGKLMPLCPYHCMNWKPRK